MAYELRCKKCGKKLLSYEAYQRKYGSPLKNCKACGAEYIDPRFHELAIEGYPEQEFKKVYSVIMIVIGGLILWRGIYMFGLHQMGLPEEMQWVLPGVITLLGVAFIIGGVVDLIRIATGLKVRKFEKLMNESRERMADENYTAKLEWLGYIKKVKVKG